jgi:hypothetical protein
MSKWVVAVVSVVALAGAGSAWGAPSRPAAGIVVKVGQSRTFAAGALRPGETVRCVDEGHVLSVEAPGSPAISNGTVWTQSGTRHFHLHVTVKKGGGYVVDCGPGGFHFAPAVAGEQHQPATHRPPDWYLIA